MAVDEDFVSEDHILRDGSELALIPPVGGGEGDGERVRAQILDTSLSIDAALARVEHRSAGGQVVFIGVVRDHNEDQRVTGITYEAYAPMARKVLNAIAHEVEAAMPGVRVAVDHRVGELTIGDRAVVVATSAPHRAEAFAACQRVIDRLKEDAPIWKHERREDGVVWVGLGP